MGKALDTRRFYGDPNTPGHHIVVSSCWIKGENSANTVSYIVRQIATSRMLVENSETLVRGIVHLQAASVTAPGQAQIVVSPFEGGTEHLRSLWYNRLNTWEGHQYRWLRDGTVPRHGYAGLPLGFEDDAPVRFNDANIDLGALGGNFSYAAGVSGDGSVIVGAAFTGSDDQHAFKWTEGGGMVDLDGRSGRFSYANGVSDDGTIIIGNYETLGDGTQGAFRWTQADGFVFLGALGGNDSFANGISHDGTTIVGSADLAGDTHGHAFRWTEGDGMHDLGTLGGLDSEAYGCSADGSVIVGFSLDGDGAVCPFLWTQLGGMINLGSLGGGSGAEASAVSGDGRIVVGVASTVAGPDHAFMWTQADGMIDLDPLYDGTTGANAISRDGTVIVGFAEPQGGIGYAFVWTQTDGVQPLDSQFTNGGGAEALAISTDKSVIVGDSADQNAHSHAAAWDRTADAPAPAYATGAVHFDGSTFIDMPLPLLGGVASSSLLFSAWFKNPIAQLSNLAESMCFLCTSPQSNFEITGIFSAPPFGGMFVTTNQNSPPNGNGGIASTTLFPPDQTAWHHFAVSADFSVGDPDNVYQLYLDGVALDVSLIYGPTSVPYAFPWNSTDADMHLFVLSDGTSDVATSVDIADMYFNPYERIDLSIPSNLAKFIRDGKPVDLGADGSAVTGSRPAFFFRRAPHNIAASFETNLGTAGDGTPTGTLTTADSSPTD